MVTEGEIDQGFNVIGVGLLIYECIGEQVGRVDSLKLTDYAEGITLRRLHLDPIVRADSRLELQARDGEPLGSPPLCYLLWIAKRREHSRTRRRQNAP